MNTLNIHEIKKILPHRYPFLLVDSVSAYESGDSLTAIKNVTFNEPCFQGHFPKKPIFPGVLIIEAMAQASALLGWLSMKKKPEAEKIYYLIGVNNVRFKKIVQPGDQLILNVKFVKVKKDLWKFIVTSTVDDKMISSAEILTSSADQ